MFIHARRSTRSKIKTSSLVLYLQLFYHLIYIISIYLVILYYLDSSRRLLTLSNQAFCVGSASVFLKLLAEKNLGGFIQFLDHSHTCYY